jgi:heat-inducible transcriptional repressor
MELLTERQDMLLGLIVREYVEHAQPVGSKYLVETFHLDLSSATVRNEMLALSDSGYLRQPYTSAGRVPTEKGYRYFVQRLIGDTELPTAEKRTISHQFFQARGDMDQWMRLAASILAQHSSAAAMVTAPIVDRAIFRHLELILIQGRQVLLVMVLQGGDVQQQFLTLEVPITQAELGQAAAQLNAMLEGADCGRVGGAAIGLTPVQQSVVAVVLDLMRRADYLSTAGVVHDGLANVLSQPEFADQELASRALRLLEEQGALRSFFTRALSAEVGGVHVVIGGEGDYEDLRDCSVVISRYGTPGLVSGALGVLGPTRLAYGRTISTVRYVSEVMSDLVTETLNGS